MPTVGDMNHSTSSSEEPCQGQMPQDLGKMPPEVQHSQRHDNYDNCVHANINVLVTLLMILGDVYVLTEFKNPDTSIIAASLEQYDEGYSRPNADLESRPPCRSREHLN